MKEKKLTLRQFSDKVGYSTRQISRYISQGKLIPKIGLNGRNYFTEDDVERFNKFFTNNKDFSVLSLTEPEDTQDGR